MGLPEMWFERKIIIMCVGLLIAEVVNGERTAARLVHRNNNRVKNTKRP